MFCCSDERRLDGGEFWEIGSVAGRLRSFGDELITLRVVVLTTDRGGEFGFVLKRSSRFIRRSSSFFDSNPVPRKSECTITSHSRKTETKITRK